MSNSQLKPGISEIVVKFFRDSIIPLILAVGYSYWAYVTSDSVVKWPDIVKNFSVAFFFLMWFVGQFLRVQKQLSDQKMLSDIHTGVNSIVNVVVQSGTVDAQEPLEQQIAKIEDPLAQALFREAFTALNSGLSISALLSAAVAFEHVFRDFAERQGIQQARTLPMGRLIRSTSQSFAPGIAEELQRLWHARNRIVHFDEEQLAQMPAAETLLEGFFWAVELLTLQNRPM